MKYVSTVLNCRADIYNWREKENGRKQTKRIYMPILIIL